MHFPCSVAWKMVTQAISFLTENKFFSSQPARLIWTVMFFVWRLVPSLLVSVSLWQHIISAPVKLKAVLSGETSLSGCSFSLGPVVKRPSGVSLFQSCFVNPRLVPVRFLIYKNRKKGELAPAYLPLALPCCCLNSCRDRHLPDT